MSSTEKVLCISDLHLNPGQPEIADAFTAFLQNEAAGALALYILGDFFNVWIGDDNPDAFAEEIKRALRALSDSGTSIYIMHGNRDFLIGEKFCTDCGATLIQEPYLLEVNDSKYLLVHGDALCTKDTDYMAFRSMVRNPAWQKDFLKKPLEERQAFAQQARKQSKAMSSNKAEDIMDVTPEEVVLLMESINHDILIHGHTHRPAIHDIDLSEGNGKRIVLGDWAKTGWYLEITTEGYALVDFPIQA